MFQHYFLTDEERTWLTDPDARLADLGSAPMVLKHRVLSLEDSWTEVTLRDVTFIECSFVNNRMYRVNLHKVRFIDCDFGATRWEHDLWDDVSFKDCYFDGGNVEILVDTGTRSHFEGCWFHGTQRANSNIGQSEPPSPENPCEIYAPGRATFVGCEFNRARVEIDVSAELRQCTFSRTFVRSRRPDHFTHQLIIENCTGEYNLGLSRGHIGEIKIKDCDLEGVFLGGTKGHLIELQNVRCSVGIEECNVAHIRLINTTFYNYRSSGSGLILGLDSTESELVEFIDCKFPGSRPRIDCEPEKISPDTITSRPTPGPTRIETLRLRNTDLPGGNFNQAIIQNFELEQLEAGNLTFKKAHIGTLSLKNVTLNGTFDVTDGGKVDKVVKDGLKKGRKFELLRDKKEAVDL